MKSKNKKQVRFDSNHIDSELSKNNECVQNIQPSPNILKIFKNSGYSTEEAVSDICDNSIDAGCKNIWIDVDSDPNNDDFYRMQIADDGIGMTPTILFGGLVVGADERELQESVKNKDEDLGKYGTGWNSSLSDLEPDSVDVHTSKINRDLHTTHYSGKELYENNWNLKVKKVTDDKLINDFEKKVGGKHGTWQVLNKITSFPESNSLDDVLSELRTKLSRRFYKYLDNINIFINGVKLVGEDIMGYDIPFREPKNFSNSAKSYKSDRIFKQTYDADEINSYITNHEHKVPDTAEITLEFFLFPQTDVLKKGDFTKYYGWNMENAGIAFFRHHRGIQFGKWAPFANTDSYLTRCGMRISFTPCLDNYFGCDYRKTRVNPLEYLYKMLNGTVQTLFTQAKNEFKKHRTIKHGNGNTMLDKVLLKISKWFKKNNTVLPKLPPVSQSSKENLGTGKKRGKYKKRKVTEKITFDYYESDTNELYRTVTNSKFANCCEIHWNHGHTFFQNFIEKVDDSMLFPIVTTIVAEHWAREQNRPDEPKADRSYYDQLQQLDELQGEWMEKMWKHGVNY